MNLSAVQFHVLASQESAENTQHIPHLCARNGLHADIFRTGGADADTEGDSSGRELRECRHGTGRHREVAYLRMGNARRDFDSPCRNRDGAQRCIKFAPNHMRIADPKTVEPKRFGLLGQSHTIARVLRGKKTDAKFYVRQIRLTPGKSEIRN